MELVFPLHAFRVKILTNILYSENSPAVMAIIMAMNVNINSIKKGF